jgi:hypothetical protein
MPFWSTACSSVHASSWPTPMAEKRPVQPSAPPPVVVARSPRALALAALGRFCPASATRASSRPARRIPSALPISVVRRSTSASFVIEVHTMRSHSSNASLLLRGPVALANVLVSPSVIRARTCRPGALASASDRAATVNAYASTSRPTTRTVWAAPNDQCAVLHGCCQNCGEISRYSRRGRWVHMLRRVGG